MRTINFKNNDNKTIIILSNFIYSETEIRIFDFDININDGIFSARTRIESEKYDFVNLLSGLKKLYDFKIKTISFCPIETQFNLMFSLLDNGQIKVSGYLSNKMKTSKLGFEFISDQTFIPDLVYEIEDVLSNASDLASLE